MWCASSAWRPSPASWLSSCASLEIVTSGPWRSWEATAAKSCRSRLERSSSAVRVCSEAVIALNPRSSVPISSSRSTGTRVPRSPAATASVASASVPSGRTTWRRSVRAVDSSPRAAAIASWARSAVRPAERWAPMASTSTRKAPTSTTANDALRTSIRAERLLAITAAANSPGRRGDCTPPVFTPQGGVLRFVGARTFVLAPAAHRAFHLALGLALADGLALVVDVLAAGQGDLDLGVGALEVHARRDDGQAAFADPAGETIDLPAMQQELTRAVGLVVLAGGGLIRRDVEVVQPQLALRGQRRVAVAHLRAV